MAAATVVALIGATTLLAQNKPEQTKPEKGANPATQEVVVLDASNQLAQLKGAQLGGSGKTVTAVPINLMQASGYRPGLDVVAFRFAGTLDNAGGNAGGDNKPTQGEDQSPTSAAGKGAGTVLVQGIVSTRPDLTQDELMRIAHGGQGLKELPPGHDPAKDPKDPLKDPKDPAKDPTKDPTKDGLDSGKDNPESPGAVLFECRTSSMQTSGKGRTFEIIGCQSADAPGANKLSADRIADVKRRLTEAGSAHKSEGAGAPAAGESKSPTVSQALDCIEKGKAFLYLNVMPDLPTVAKGPTETFVLKDVTFVFAAVPKSAP
jgi:hypothetical protein